MTTAMYAVEEMIHQPWKAAVSQRVRPVLGVRKAAAVDLDAGGRSPADGDEGSHAGGQRGSRERRLRPHFRWGSEVSGGVIGGLPRTVIPNPIVNDRCLLWNVRGGTITDGQTVEPVEELSYVRFPGPARCTSRARALVHLESTLAAGHRLGRPTGTFKAKAVRQEARPALSWVWLPGTLLAAFALTWAQASLVRRRYDNLPPGVSEVDMTVEPTGRSSGGLPPVELAAFGDSAVAGVGVEHAKDSLPVQLAQRVADGLARRVHVVGYGRSGARTADVLAAQIPLARGGPDVSVLLVGTNDVTHVTPLHRLARGSDALLEALLDLGGPVVMSGLPEFRALTAVPHPLREAAIAYGALVRAVQRRRALIHPGVHLVDVRCAVGAEFVSEPATMSADSFHPSAAGYARIADAMAPTVVAVLTTRTAHQEGKS